jgi:hypothetical protein
VLLAILPLFATACGSSGGGAGAPRTKVVAGPGFRFSAPQDWRVGRTETSAAAHSPADRRTAVSAVVYRLGRPYEPSEFEAAAKELDAVAGKLARAANGTVTASETTTVADRKVRAYRFTAREDGRSTQDRVGFVLAGKREVQLLCVAPAGGGDPDGACGLLFSSFTLTGG